MRLRLTEIFYSLQGETASSGLPTVFIRLTGCPLRCKYCDTTYAFQGGKWLDIEAICQTVKSYSTPYVTVTGGEPLAQKACLYLMKELCDEGYIVSLETSGALPLFEVDNRVIKIMDIKTPASGEVEKNLWENLQTLSSKDQIKFVICDYEDYLWSKSLISKHQLNKNCQILFSPSYGQLQPKDLADWILADQLPVRFQIQLHKFLWGDVPGK